MLRRSKVPAGDGSKSFVDNVVKGNLRAVGDIKKNKRKVDEEIKKFRK